MVRYADGPTAEVGTTVAAPAAAVWSLVSDIGTPVRLSPEVVATEWLDEGPALGARFRGHNRHEVVGEWRVTCVVTALEEERVFEWSVVHEEQRAACWRFELHPRDDGTTRLVFRAVMGPGPSGLTPAIRRSPHLEERIVANRLAEWRENMQRTVDGIAALAEGREPATG